MIDHVSRHYLIWVTTLLIGLLLSACGATYQRSTVNEAPARESYELADSSAMRASSARTMPASDMNEVASMAMESRRDWEEAPPAGPPADMFFEDYGVNSFEDAVRDNLSTFAVDVDTGAYTVARRYVTDGWLPPIDAVRAEEFINYFDYDYPLPTKAETFNIVLDAAPSPFASDDDRRILRVGIQGYDVPADERKDVALTFVIDVSGSMAQENRLGLVKRGLSLLVEELRPTDSVAIVVYGSNARMVLPMTPLAERDVILRAIRSLESEGSTNAEAGLKMGYRHAYKRFNPDVNNRVVLASDGVANVGATGPDAILETIERYAEEGITMTAVGFGMGNYNDVLMEQLANKGDGFYAYVDSIDEARKLFVDDLTGTLETIAMDAKVQVEFDPRAVDRYRLIGYENRDVADDDFRNDEVDAGEIGAGHSVTALYEVVMRSDEEDGARDVERATPLATVYLRWQDPDHGEVVEISNSLTAADVADEFSEADPGFQLAVTVAEYADVLRASPWSTSTLGEVYGEATRIDRLFADDDDVTEFADLVWLAAELAEDS